MSDSSLLHSKGFIQWKHEGSEVLCFSNSPLLLLFFFSNKVMGRITETFIPRKYYVSLLTSLP